VREHEASPESAVGAAAERSPAATGSAAADLVVALQQSLGNRAVTRLLARQEAPVPTGPTRIEREDPLIHTVRGPILEDHGFYRWLVRFQLPFAAESDGWLIQELYQDSYTGHGDHFWEAWRIRSGTREHEDPDTEEGVLYDDRYVHGRGGAAPDAAGWHRHVGVIRFYPGPLPSEFERTRANFGFTRTRPANWTGQGTRHDAYAEWRPGLNGFVAYAGTTELRRGDRVTFRPRTSSGPTRLDTEPEAVPQRL
jgi:hypothetical protein